MNKSLLLYIFGFCMGFFFPAQAQQYLQEASEKSNVLSKAEQAISGKIVYKKAFFLGVELLPTIYDAFNKNKTYEFFVHLRLYKKFHLAYRLGHSRLSFDRLGWKASVSGAYHRLGFHWFLYEQPLDYEQSYYTGLYLGYSPYQQEIDKRFMRHPEISNTPLPKVKLQAFWFEPVVGARVRLAKTPFFIDVAAGSKVLLYAKKQEGIDPLTIPGFGEALYKIKWTFRWGLSFRIPLEKTNF